MLGVRRDCSFAEIKAAWIGKVKSHHPDRQHQANTSGGPGGQGYNPRTFVNITTAFQVLLNPETRQEYDMLLGVRPTRSNAVQQGDGQQQSASEPKPGPKTPAGRQRRRSGRQEQSEHIADWWDVPNMTGIHDAGYGFTANLNSAIYGSFKLDERWQSETALPSSSAPSTSATGLFEDNP